MKPNESREKVMGRNIRNFLKRVPFARRVKSYLLRQQYRAEGKKIFKNWEDYVSALTERKDGSLVLLTHDGLKITLRRNIFDAQIIREMLVERPYIKYISLPDRPNILDIGGYIGDFTIYAAKYLRANRVVVYEPTAENYALLIQNVENNHLTDRVVVVNKAVSDASEITLNVQIKDNQEVHSSAYWYENEQQRTLPSVTISDIFEQQQFDIIDLLKVDCEGAEYNIFASIPDELFARINNIVFEYHQVSGYKERLAQLKKRLEMLGYTLVEEGIIISAFRPTAPA